MYKITNKNEIRTAIAIKNIKQGDTIFSEEIKFYVDKNLLLKISR